MSDNYLNFNSANLLVNGEIKSVEGTKYDFRNYTRLGDRIVNQGNWPSQGFDNYFITNQQSGKKYVARYYSFKLHCMQYK